MAILKRIKNRLKLLSHAGSTYYCPFCGYRSKDLEITGHDLPVLIEKHVIGGGRRAAGCYKCHSRDRERLLYAFLMEELNIGSHKNLKILHVAPEPKLSQILINQNFEEYICGDLFTEGYVYPIYVRNMNVLNIPYGDNHFNLIICNHVLEHIPDDIAVMKELYRVLAPKGTAILQVPISKNSATTSEDFTIADPKMREQLFGQFDHVRIYGQDYTDRLKTAGFEVTKTNITKKYAHFGLNPQEDIYTGKKL